MTATTHALLAGVIATSVPDPKIGLALSAISHPLADLIPHWDFGYDWKHTPKVKLFIECTLDLTLGTILAYLLFGQYISFWYFAAAIFVSEIWDILEAPYWILKWQFPPFSWIYEVQHRMQNKATLPLGIVTQVLTLLGVILLFQYIGRI